MDISHYYITTLSTAGNKVLPVLGALVVGYLLFVKLPFLFFVKVLRENKTPDEGGMPQNGEASLKGRKEILKEIPFKRPLSKTKVKRPEDQTPEELFELQSTGVISKKALKKKYHQLLKEYHPDRAANLSPGNKALAEKRAKIINSAYEKLKKDAA